jgi:hypothetical protein
VVRFGCRRPGASFVDLIADQVHESLNSTASARPRTARSCSPAWRTAMSCRHGRLPLLNHWHRPAGRWTPLTARSTPTKLVNTPAGLRQLRTPGPEAAFTFHVTVRDPGRCCRIPRGQAPAGDGAAVCISCHAADLDLPDRMAAGEDTTWSRTPHTPPLRSAARPGLPGLARRHLDAASSRQSWGLDFFTTSGALPFDKCDQVFVPGYSAVPRECRLRDHLRPGAVPLAGDRQPYDMARSPCSLYEMAHMDLRRSCDDMRWWGICG